MKKFKLFIIAFALTSLLLPASAYAEAVHSPEQEQLERQQAQPSQTPLPPATEQDMHHDELHPRNEKIEQAELKIFGPYLYEKIEVLHRFHDNHPALFILGAIIIILAVIALVVYIVKYFKRRSKNNI
jgi:hypothetical protein